jgi:hypothetical protein
MNRKMTTRRANVKLRTTHSGQSVFSKQTRAKYEKILREVSRESQPIEDKVRESQQLSKDDLAIRVNARS